MARRLERRAALIISSGCPTARSRLWPTFEGLRKENTALRNVTRKYVRDSLETEFGATIGRPVCVLRSSWFSMLCCSTRMNPVCGFSSSEASASMTVNGRTNSASCDLHRDQTVTVAIGIRTSPDCAVGVFTPLLRRRTRWPLHHAESVKSYVLKSTLEISAPQSPCLQTYTRTTRVPFNPPMPARFSKAVFPSRPSGEGNLLLLWFLLVLRSAISRFHRIGL